MLAEDLETDNEIVNKELQKLKRIFYDKDCKEVVWIDILSTDLAPLMEDPLLGMTVTRMIATWTMGDEDRIENVRIGSIKVFRDEDRLLHLDFVARF